MPGEVDGVIVLGGSMGTDLALDVAAGAAARRAEIRRLDASPIRTCCRRSASRPT